MFGDDGVARSFKDGGAWRGTCRPQQNTPVTQVKKPAFPNSYIGPATVKKRDRNSQTSQNTFGEAPSEADKSVSPPLFRILSNYEQ